MAIQKSLISITKMTICGNWLLSYVDLFPQRHSKLFRHGGRPSGSGDLPSRLTECHFPTLIPQTATQQSPNRERRCVVIPKKTANAFGDTLGTCVHCVVQLHCVLCHAFRGFTHLYIMNIRMKKIWTNDKMCTGDILLLILISKAGYIVIL